MSFPPSLLNEEVQSVSGKSNFLTDSNQRHNVHESLMVPVEIQMVIYEQQHVQESTRVELRSPASVAVHLEMHMDPVVPKLLCTF